MKKSINREIAITHIRTRKKQTLIAALGVTLGIGMYIFSTSLMAGFTRYSRAEMFKTIAHIKVYNENAISKPLVPNHDSDKIVLINNPRIVTSTASISNPFQLLDKIKQQQYIVNAAPQVNVDLFYKNGESQIKGMASGVHIAEANTMFNIQSTMLAGDMNTISTNLNAILIGKGIAEKMNVGLNDNISISSSQGVIKVLKITGIFSVGNKSIDESKCYLHISTAQQLLKKGPSYITEIYANIKNPDDSELLAAELQKLTEYKAEGWQTTYSDTLSADKIRDIMGTAVPVVIMLVAAFGIYNILNMTVTQKLNDIAILKATGFSGADIVKIFVTEAFIMGIIGVAMGISIGAVLIYVLQHIYVGGPVGFFPIYFNFKVFISASIAGMLVTLGAGYFPARKAARVDPVDIFRK